MAFTSVNRNSISDAASATTIGISVTGVHVGDFVFVWAGDGDSQAITGVSDGTSGLTGLTGRTSTAVNGRVFYLLASVTSGTVTYTATFAAAATNRFIGAWVFTPSGSVSFDQEGGGADNDASVSSGNITTTSGDVLVVAGDLVNNGAHASLQIGGVAADGTDSDGLGAYWYRATTGTVAATATETSNTQGVCAIASFVISAGSSSSVSPSVSPSASISKSPSLSPSPSASQSLSASQSPSASISPSPAGVIVMERTVFYYVD